MRRLLLGALLLTPGAALAERPSLNPEQLDHAPRFEPLPPAPRLMPARRATRKPRALAAPDSVPPARIESPTDYDFQPENLAPVDWSYLQSLGMTAGGAPAQDRAGAPAPAAALPAGRRVSCWLVAPDAASSGGRSSCF